MRRRRGLIWALAVLVLAAMLALPGCKDPSREPEPLPVTVDPATEAATTESEPDPATDPSPATEQSATTAEPATSPDPEPAPEPEPEPEREQPGVPVEEGEYYYDLEHVASYLVTFGELPPNYVTKREAEDAGWEGGSVEDYIEDAAIGGNVFRNRERMLPTARGRTYYECDIDTHGRRSRGARRLIYSDDGLLYYTSDHYESFQEVHVGNGKVTVG